jgi:hypothetical protein
MGKNRVKYGGRAFQQDASNAMKGDIVRGLIELITNCDDAYGDSNGKVRIEVEHRRNKPWSVIVRDRARGMSATTMRDAIGGLGERTSGFELGLDVRGNLGRGAKDLAAFGPVTFESIHDGRYARMVLEEDGTYDDPIDRKVTEQDRDRLHIVRGNGTTVAVAVASNFKCPQHAKMLERLSKHYQLRDINSDPRREITLVDFNSGNIDSVRFGQPSLPEVVSTELSIGGYPDATATLTIFRNQERYDNGSSDTGRPEGILVKGSRAIYENSLFSSEANPYSHWFSGSVRCPTIDALARQYDEEQMFGAAHHPENPIRIITRSRDGLEHDHPFYKALAASLDAVLEPLVRAEQEKAQEGTARESLKLRRTLDQLGRDLGKLIDADLREIDEDGLDGTGTGDDEEMIRVIPQNPVLYMGENKTISVVARKSLDGTEVTLEPDPEGVVELLDGPISPLVDHPRRDEFSIAQVRLKPLIEDEETYLTVKLGDHEVVVLVEVRPQREDPEPSIPETFQFERERYQMTAGKRRTLRLIAPVEVLDTRDGFATLSSSSQEVVVLGNRVELQFDEDALCYVGAVSVDPRVLGAKASLTATLGELEATCDVVVVQNEGSGPSLDIKIVDEAAGKHRARVERTGDQTVIKILGGHPAMRRYLGPGPDFPNQETLQARVVVAEIVAGEATRMVMERKFAVAGELDAPAFYSEHSSLLTKYLTRCHKQMVADQELP